MKITLHIGVPQAGASEIQRILNINSTSLLEKKILFSTQLQDAGKPYLKGAGGTKLINLTNQELLRQKIDFFNGFFRESGIQHFIWSLESLLFSGIDEIKQVKNILETNDFEIIIFVRRQDYWFQSMFYQWGWNHKTYTGKYLIGFDEFYQKWKQKGFFDQFIDNWSAVFGDKNIKVFPIENHQTSRELVRIFCELTGLDFSLLTFDKSSKTTELDHYANLVIGICNSVFEETTFNPELIEMMRRNLNIASRQSLRASMLISPAQRLEIVNEFQLSNKRITNKYLKKDDELFTDPLPDANEPWEPYEPITLERFIPIIIDILLAHERRIYNMEKQVKSALKTV